MLCWSYILYAHDMNQSYSFIHYSTFWEPILSVVRDAAEPNISNSGVCWVSPNRPIPKTGPILLIHYCQNVNVKFSCTWWTDMMRNALRKSLKSVRSPFANILPIFTTSCMSILKRRSFPWRIKIIGCSGIYKGWTTHSFTEPIHSSSLVRSHL